MKGNIKFSIYPRELLFSIFIIIFPFSLFAQYWLGIGWMGYFDEALGIICAFYLLYKSLKRGIKGIDLVLLILMLVCIAIGFVGNLNSRVINEFFPIIVDVIALAKMFFVYLVFKIVAKSDVKHRMVSYLLPVSKLFFIAATFVGTLNLFVNLGMGTISRYFFRSFAFLFIYETMHGYISICFLFIILLSNCKKSVRIFYEVLAIYNMILTTKGAVYIALVCYIVLVIMWRRSAKLSIGNIVFLAIGGISVSTFQIRTYLLDDESARMRLINYGLKTANTYFPFGSGFATYGSDMAAEYYSSLYDQYGFEKFYGLSRSYGAFLNDCYLGMLFGQFGYIGTIVFFSIMVILFITINNIKVTNNNCNVKALAMATFIGVVVGFVGGTLIKSVIGVMIFAIFGIVSGYSEAAQAKTLNNGEAVLDENSKTILRKRRTIKFK